ncbi:hypothetical protein AGMMS49579_25850 [Spirochaetia bacterium]|nr:hypothetical protein AGMMS49579_25850 [Spirochaetia bacterium]
MLLMIALSLMVLAGCKPETDDTEPEGKTVTLTLAKASATSFTITVDGANWTNAYVADLVDFSVLTYNNAGTAMMVHDTQFNQALSGKVVTATLKSAYSGLAGTLKLMSDEELTRAYGSVTTDGGRGTSIGGTTTYVGKPAKGITFP